MRIDEADIRRLFHADLRIKAAHSILEVAGGGLANRVRADPAFIVAMAGFILYQVCRMSFDVTILLAAITVLGIAVLALAAHEYRFVRRDRHLPRETDG